jgi:hypothetical protein
VLRSLDSREILVNQNLTLVFGKIFNYFDFWHRSLRRRIKAGKRKERASKLSYELWKRGGSASLEPGAWSLEPGAWSLEPRA